MKAIITRYGAYGDMIIMSPILPFLKRDGYHITLDCNGRGEQVLRYNPYIDKYHIHDESIPVEELDKHWSELHAGYDKVINLTGSIEGGLLKSEWHDKEGFNLSHEERHKQCNVNYYDRTLELAGYPVKGLRGELYFSPNEHEFGRKIRRKFKNKFLILWSLSGSSYHKTYPQSENIAKAFLEAHPDVQIILVGDNSCVWLEWDHERSWRRSGVWPIRKSLAMTRYADLVVGTETGIINAAGCFDTPKVVFLSHSSEENLTKNFKNCTSLHAGVDCYPCHRLIYTRAACPQDIHGCPVCMSELRPAKVLNAMEDYYKEWRNGSLHRQRERHSVYIG